MASRPHCLKSSEDESAAGISEAVWARQMPFSSRLIAGRKNRKRIGCVRGGNVALRGRRCRVRRDVLPHVPLFMGSCRRNGTCGSMSLRGHAQHLGLFWPGHFSNDHSMRTFFRISALAFFACTCSAQAATVALVGGRLIDGFGGPPLANSVILIEGDRIKAIGQVGKLQVPAGAEVISTEGMDVLPGLWDAHVHTMLLGHSNYEHWDKTYPARFGSEIMPAAAKQLLLAGVTSARDLGAPLKESIEVRDRIKRGEIPGPTLYVSGPFIQHEPYPGTEAFRWGVKGAEDGRAKVKKLAEAGVNIIKLIDQDQMTPEEVKAVVDEAHKHKLPVVAHGHRPEEIRRGLAAGADCFEHTGLATAPGYPADVLNMNAE